MYHYEYVAKKEAEPYRHQIEEIVHKVQDIVRDKFTFHYTFIGSSARNMITYDPKTKMGFDFDINFYPNDDDNIYPPDQLKQILINAINHVAPKYGFKYCEDSPRVITVKKLNPWTGAVTFCFDIAIVHNYDDPNKELRQEYIRINKKQGSYSWEDQPNGYHHLKKKIAWIKSQKYNLWNEVLDLYLGKKT